VLSRANNRTACIILPGERRPIRGGCLGFAGLVTYPLGAILRKKVEAAQTVMPLPWSYLLLAYHDEEIIVQFSRPSHPLLNRFQGPC
jgi:hypothetical protein